MLSNELKAILTFNIGQARRIAILIAVVFIILRLPLLPRAFRHGWYFDVPAHQHHLVLARSFVQEGGATPFFLFPRHSPRVDETEPWLLYTSWPPLGDYLLAPIFLLPTSPHVHLMLARLLAVTAMAGSSLLLFAFFRPISQHTCNCACGPIHQPLPN